MLTSVGVRTYAENTTVENEVYLLDAGTTNPEKGTKVASFVSTFEYGGFHRIALPSTVTLKPGTRFSIVSTGYVKRSDGNFNYGLAASKADSQAYAQKKLNQGNKTWVYGKAVVNKGESYLYWNGGWYDWRECIDNGLSVSGLVAQGEEDPGDMGAQDDPTVADDISRYAPAIEGGDSVVDNFTIKAYTLPASAAPSGKADIDPAPTGTELSEEYSNKNAGEKSGDSADWPKDGFTDDGLGNEDQVVEDLDAPSDGKDYYDADWDGKKPTNSVVPSNEQPSPQPANQDGQATSSQTPKSASRNNASTSTAARMPRTGDNARGAVVPCALAGIGATVLGAHRKKRNARG